MYSRRRLWTTPKYGSLLVSATMTDDTERPTMKDVTHTPPAGESVTNVWHRGEETEADVDAAAD